MQLSFFVCFNLSPSSLQTLVLVVFVLLITAAMVVLDAIDDYYNNHPFFLQLIRSDSGYILGSHVDDYDNLQEINRGSFGVVYKARNNLTNQTVAMKKEIQGLSRSTLREIEILKSLPHHPSIVKFEEAVMDVHGGVFVVMEYLEKDLQRFMHDKREDLTVSEVKFVMKQILEGVSFLHKQGVMHRDLKPSNILIHETGALKICDFGLSCYFGNESTQRGCRVGTRWYRAPELYWGDRSYSHAIDMWSVGCIMAELILKEVLFQGKTDEDQLERIYKLVGAPFLNLLRLKFDVATCSLGMPFLTNSGYDLLERLLAVDPSKRITAEDALNHAWFKEYYGFSS